MDDKIVWNIGCSGFHYKHWKGLFYPKGLAQTKWFHFYCEHFNTLELNVSFYRFPRVSTLETWYKNSPEGFLFSVKAPRAITHFKKFISTERMMDDLYTNISTGLKEKLGCVLFQLPPNIHYAEKHLERIINSLDTNFLNVVEFRHESWWQQQVFEELGKKNIAFCGMSHPGLPKDIISNANHFYYRLHGTEQIYASDYAPNELKELASAINDKPNVRQANVFFNNDINGYAVQNAKTLITLTKR